MTERGPRIAATAALLFLGLAALYLATLGTLHNWDSLYLGISMATGEPSGLMNPLRPFAGLPYLSAWTAMQGLDVEVEPLRLLGLLNAILGAATITLLYLLLVGDCGREGPALAASLFVAFSMGFWFRAVHGKWHPFVLLTMVVFLLALQTFSRARGQGRTPLLLGVVAGLALLVHGTLVSLVAAAALALLREGPRRSLPAAAGALALTLALGLACTFSLVLLSHWEGSPEAVLTTWSRDFSHRHLAESLEPLRPLRLVAPLITGVREPSGELFPVPDWVQACSWPVLALLALATWAAWRFPRPGTPLQTTLVLFLWLHLLLLGFVDPTNENLVAVLPALAGLLAPALAALGARWRPALPLAFAGVLALALANGAMALQNRDERNNPYLEFVASARQWTGPDGFLLTHQSLRTMYLSYFMARQVLILYPQVPESRRHVRARVLHAAARGRRVVADPSLTDVDPGTWAPDPSLVLTTLEGMVWEPLLPGRPDSPLHLVEAVQDSRRGRI